MKTKIVKTTPIVAETLYQLSRIGLSQEFRIQDSEYGSRNLFCCNEDIPESFSATLNIAGNFQFPYQISSYTPESFEAIFSAYQTGKLAYVLPKSLTDLSNIDTIYDLARLLRNFSMFEYISESISILDAALIHRNYELIQHLTKKHFFYTSEDTIKMLLSHSLEGLNAEAFASSASELTAKAGNIVTPAMLISIIPSKYTVAEISKVMQPLMKAIKPSELTLLSCLSYQKRTSFFPDLSYANRIELIDKLTSPNLQSWICLLNTLAVSDSYGTWKLLALSQVYGKISEHREYKALPVVIKETLIQSCIKSFQTELNDVCKVIKIIQQDGEVDKTLLSIKNTLPWLYSGLVEKTLQDIKASDNCLGLTNSCFRAAFMHSLEFYHDVYSLLSTDYSSLKKLANCDMSEDFKAYISSENSETKTTVLREKNLLCLLNDLSKTDPNSSFIKTYSGALRLRKAETTPSTKLNTLVEFIQASSEISSVGNDIVTNTSTQALKVLKYSAQFAKLSINFSFAIDCVKSPQIASLFNSGILTTNADFEQLVNSKSASKSVATMRL